MTAIEPGQSYKITYGNDHELTVQALTAGRLKTLVELICDAQEAEATSDFAMMRRVPDMYLEALTICCGDADEAKRLFNESVDFQMIGEIVNKTMGKQALSEDEKKKPELQPS